jgi:hypothetical protein
MQRFFIHAHTHYLIPAFLHGSFYGALPFPTRRDKLSGETVRLKDRQGLLEPYDIHTAKG